MFPLNMTAAMHLTVLVSLLTATVCRETTVFSETKLRAVTTTNASQFLSNSTSSSTVKAITITPQVYTSTRLTTDVASVEPQTTRIETTSLSNTTLNTTTTQWSIGTDSQEPTVPSSELLNVTANTTVNSNSSANTTVNSTSSGLSSNWKNDDLATNPGLVAVLCIFCIVLALSLVVIMVKCIRSPRSNFEKLEDMPMGKVNEESPFAHYSK